MRTTRLGREVRSGQQREGPRSLSDWARTHASGVLEPVAQALDRLGIHPNTITLAGLMLQIGVGILYYHGFIRRGGLLLLIFAPLDALDGAVARAGGKQSTFGAFFDSTLDRFSDAALILGLTSYYLQRGMDLQVNVLLIALVFTLLVSYTRARAEALGIACKVGLLTRMERIALIGVLTAVGVPNALVWALSLLSVITVGQRIGHVYLYARGKENQ